MPLASLTGPEGDYIALRPGNPKGAEVISAKGRIPETLGKIVASEVQVVSSPEVKGEVVEGISTNVPEQTIDESLKRPA